MMEKNIRIEIKGEKETAREFVDAWHRAEKGEPPEEPINRVYFQKLETLLKTLTPRRLDLLKAIHSKNDTSVRALAAFLSRDYKNVYQDVKSLEAVGLIIRGAKGLSVPWERIVADIQLAA
jgi:predicted transcriptional regulator